MIFFFDSYLIFCWTFGWSRGLAWSTRLLWRVSLLVSGNDKRWMFTCATLGLFWHLHIIRRSSNWSIPRLRTFVTYNSLSRLVFPPFCLVPRPLLISLIQVFYSSMLPLLSTKEITVVFANIEDLLLTNTVWLSKTHYSSRSEDCLQGFVSSLEERQKDCRLYVDRIGDILFNHLPNMGVYMVRSFESFGQSSWLTETM